MEEGKKDKPKAIPLEELTNAGWSPEDVEELSDIMAQRHDMAGREKVMEAAKKELNERASFLLVTHGSPTIASQIGTMMFKVSDRRTLDKEKLKLELVTRGVPVNVIADAVEAATTVSTTSYVEFRAAKQ